MKNLLKILGITVGCGAAIFAVAYFGFGMTAFFAPKYEGVRRDVMIESRYYSEATVRELYRLKGQYLKATTEDVRQTIRATALHEFSIFPQDRLPLDLARWFKQINR